MDPIPVVDFAETFLSSLNPEPVLKETADQLITDFLSPTRLQELTGEQDLENVEFLELEVNTSETTLGNFGSFLLNLRHLKFYNSVIPTIRDLGTSLGHITVLMLSCSGMSDIDGIASMMKLKELYLSYNNISDISPLSFLDNLEVLDLEGNQLNDLSQLDYLAILGSLTTLNLSSNPMCQLSLDGLDYSTFIRNKLPHIERLDDGHETDNFPSASNILLKSQITEDVRMVTEAIKDGTKREGSFRVSSPTYPLVNCNGSGSLISDENAQAGSEPPANSTSFLLPMRPQSAYPSRISSAGSQKSEHGSNFGSRPHSSESGDVNLQDETSTLTFGQVICGNPIRALKSRRQSPLPVVSILNNAPVIVQRPATALGYRQRPKLPITKNENSSTKIDIEDKEDVLAELRSWRKMHEERMGQQVEEINLNFSSSSGSISDDELGMDSEDDQSSPYDIEGKEKSSSIHAPSPPREHEPGSMPRMSSPPPRKLSPSYRKFVPSKHQMGSSPKYSETATSSSEVYTPTPPKIGLSRPRTAADFRANNLKKSLLSLSPRAIVPISLTNPGSSSQNNLNSHKIKAVNEIKQ